MCALLKEGDVHFYVLAERERERGKRTIRGEEMDEEFRQVKWSGGREGWRCVDDKSWWRGGGDGRRVVLCC